MQSTVLVQVHEELVDGLDFSENITIRKWDSVMPGLIFSTRYQKLDDTIYLLCKHCGNSVDEDRLLFKMTESPLSSSARFLRGTPKHFLTWSATANQKLQKFSKNLAQNVSKLQFRVLHSTTNQQQGSANCQLNSVPDRRHREEDLHNHEHLLAANNVNVAVVHSLSVARRKGTEGSNSIKVDSSTDWKASSRSRRKFDFETERSKLGYGEEVELLEFPSLATELGHSFNFLSEKNSESGNSMVILTHPHLSPHWTRTSSLRNSDGSEKSSSPFPSTDTIQLTDELTNCQNSISSCHEPENRVERSKNNSELSTRILEDEPELRGAPWFHAGIPREIALEVLKNEVLGSFIVRESSSRLGCFALSLRVPSEFQPSGIAHYLILRSTRGYKIKGFTKEFGSLSSLITHHTVMPELLPCPLYRPSPLPHVSRADSADFMEPEKLLIPTPSIKYTDF